MGQTIMLLSDYHVVDTEAQRLAVINQKLFVMQKDFLDIICKHMLIILEKEISIICTWNNWW